MEPQCLPRASASPLCPVPGLFYQPWPRMGPGPSSSLPALSRSAQTVSLTQIFPKGAGGTAICPRLCPYELISCLPLAWASGPCVRWIAGRKLLIGRWKKGWGFSWA